MKAASLFLILCLPVMLWADLSLKNAKTLYVAHISRGVSVLNSQNKTSVFSYASIPSAHTNHSYDAIQYFKQLQLNDNQTLTMQTVDKNNHITKQQLDFFMGTKDIQAKVVNGKFIFLVARTPEGILKIALLDQNNKIEMTQTVQDLNVKAIYNVFSHLDGSYSVALKVENHQNRLSYFNRGIGASNTAILKFSPLLHLTQTRMIGDTQANLTVNVLKDQEDIYYVFNQSDTASLTLYKHNFFKNENEKISFVFKSPFTIHSLSSKNFSTFYLGTDQNRWMTLNIKNKHINTFSLAKVKNATIKSIDKLPDNSILVSGNYRSSNGELDIFIHKYSPFKSYLWGETYHSDFNDKILKHEYINNTIFLTTIISDKKNKTKMALFKIRFEGKNY